MTAMVDLPLALRPVIHTVTPFWPRSFSRSSRVTEPSCQVMFVAFCSAIFPSFLFKQRRAQIAFAETGHDRDDRLALVLRPRRHLRGRRHVAAATDAGEDAFF